jgi:hypothetical protein
MSVRRLALMIMGGSLWLQGIIADADDSRQPPAS